MARAQGKLKRFEPVNVAGLDTRVWQGDGTSNDAEGVVFTLRGEVAKVKGIVPLVDWIDTDPDFVTNGAFGLYQLTTMAAPKSSSPTTTRLPCSRATTSPRCSKGCAASAGFGTRRAPASTPTW